MKKIQRNVLLVLFSVLFLLTACAETQIGQSTEIKAMDFEQSFPLKKPAQVKKEPYILFLGNSITYVNDLPKMFTELSESGGFAPVVDELSDGGYRLEQFADPEDELGAMAYDALSNYQWDYVVLQEQSQLPTLAAEELMYPPARTLDQLAKKAGAETVFFLTWAYKNGDEIDLLGLKQTTTREQMQTQLAESYLTIAKELDACVAPAGIAFMKSVAQNPEIELWDEDLNHASVAGTYLAANVFYATLYQQSPVGLTYTAGLDADTAKKLQQTAAQTVLAK